MTKNHNKLREIRSRQKLVSGILLVLIGLFLAVTTLPLELLDFNSDAVAWCDVEESESSNDSTEDKEEREVDPDQFFNVWLANAFLLTDLAIDHRMPEEDHPPHHKEVSTPPPEAVEALCALV